MSIELKTRVQQQVIEDDATDLAVFVRISTDDIVVWDNGKIIKALIKETGITEEVATIIALEVEKQIRAWPSRRLPRPWSAN